MKTAVKNNLWLSIRILSLLLRKFQNRQQIKALNNSSSETVKKIGKAVRFSLNKNFSPEEKEAIKRIESIRKEYLTSEREIHRWDPEGNAEGKEKLSTVTKYGSRSEFWDTLLFQLVRNLKPLTSVEIGTCVGISAAYLGLAQKLNGEGKLTTLEGSPYRSEIARETFQKVQANVNIAVGKFDVTLRQILDNTEPIDFAFIDGNHRFAPTVDYFKALLPRLATESVLVFDDINYSPEMQRAWKKIKVHPFVNASIDLFVFGIVVVNSETTTKEGYKLSILKF